MAELIPGIGLIAAILLLSALASGIVERAPLSFPMIFLGLGLVLGNLGIIQLDSHSLILEVVGVISLTLVLFLDAVKLQIDELKQEWYVPFLTLGPGTILTILGVAAASFVLLSTAPIPSLLLGAILASTDPVVLRDIIRDERIPRSVRRALSVEAGMNDLVVLPIVLVLIAVLTAQVGSASDWVLFLLRVLVFSPLVGFVVGGIGAYLIGKADQRFGIRQEYQALYGIGLVLAAYAAGQALQGDGFLAAFFAGLAVTILNVSLCECFLAYGEVTSEMLMLLAFVLFGVVLVDLLGTVALVPTLALAVISIGVVRPAALGLVLRKAKMSSAARAFIGWFGPRGLNSLLLALLVVQAGAAGGEMILATTGMVVLVSVIAHGASATPVSAWYGKQVAKSHITMEEEREGTFTGLFDHETEQVEFVNPTQLADMLAGSNPPLILDVRSRAHYDEEDGQIPGSIRVLPDQLGDWADGRKPERPIVAYCSCPNEATSVHVAQHLNDLGFDAKALVGGYPAWKALYPVEAKGATLMPA